MKKILITSLLVISILVITYLNLSISRATQIESFLKEAIEYVEEDTVGMTYITALATTMEPSQTFLIQEIFYQKQIDNNSIYADVSLLVYTEGIDPRPKLVVFVQHLSFKDLTIEFNEFTEIQAQFMFKDNVIKDRINKTSIVVNFSQLYRPNDQLFAIDSDYLFNINTFNLNAIKIIITHNNIIYDLDMITMENIDTLEDSLITIRSLNNTKALLANIISYDSNFIDNIYRDHVKFPVINVIIEILLILGMYFLYQRFNLWYKKRYA
jgi:hypothetical protein